MGKHSTPVNPPGTDDRDSELTLVLICRIWKPAVKWLKQMRERAWLQRDTAQSDKRLDPTTGVEHAPHDASVHRRSSSGFRTGEKQAAINRELDPPA